VAVLRHHTTANGINFSLTCLHPRPGNFAYWRRTLPLAMCRLSTITGLSCVIVSQLHCTGYEYDCCLQLRHFPATVMHVHHQHVNQNKMLVFEIVCYSLFAYKRNNAITYASDSVVLHKIKSLTVIFWGEGAGYFVGFFPLSGLYATLINRL